MSECKRILCPKCGAVICINGGIMPEVGKALSEADRRKLGYELWDAWVRALKDKRGLEGSDRWLQVADAALSSAAIAALIERAWEECARRLETIATNMSMADAALFDMARKPQPLMPNPEVLIYRNAAAAIRERKPA